LISNKVLICFLGVSGGVVELTENKMDIGQILMQLGKTSEHLLLETQILLVAL